ncbi:MAG: LysM peptidoglycan-binding domain-containing protein [Janthinobacterium lividum]
MKASHQVPVTSPRRRKLARRLLALVLTLGAVPALAQRGRNPHPELPPLPTDTVRQAVELPPATLDSLAAEITVPEPAVDSVRLLWLQTPTTFGEMVGDRMACIETAAPHQCNPAVLAYVRLFTERQRSYTQHVLEREQFYFPTFEKYLAQYGLPQELKYLSVVESALIPTAKSPVGAVGLWQFMPGTGSDMRLKRDEWVDERMHPEKATEAACKYLRDLYRMFHDWELVLAAYNWGAGNVQRVIRKTGKRNFWEMYPHMPAETRNYVPTFTAIMYAMKYAPEHGLRDPALHYQSFEALDTLGLRGQAIDLRRLSRALGYADSLTLGRYNPEVRRGGLPAGYRPYVLRYPSAAREHLGDVDRATLLAYCQPVADLPRPLPLRPVRLAGVEPWPTDKEATVTAQDETTPHFRRLHYTVRRGQTVAAVAERFEVTSAQLRKWNELGKGQTLKPGRQLVVFVPLPATPAEPVIVEKAPVLTVAAPRQAADSTLRALAAANQRYAREAQATAERETAQSRALQRAKQQQAARLVAEQQRAIFRAAALAKAAAAEEKARRAAVANAEPADPASVDLTARADSAAPTEPVHHRRSKNIVTSQLARPVAPEPLPLTKVTEPVATLKPTTYTVRPGDNLTKLARTYSLTVAQLKTWNNLGDGGVEAGQRLRLTAPAETAMPVAIAARKEARPEVPSLKRNTHTVQPGDTLYNISRRFGMSVEELRQLNHLQTDEVKLGQKLVVRS